MLRNYLVMVFRNLIRERFYSVINVLGLSVGLCAALFAGLWIWQQWSYERFIPGYERTYMIGHSYRLPGRAMAYSDVTPIAYASLFSLRFPEVEQSTRLMLETLPVRHSDIKADEQIYWADSNVFDVLPLPTLAGELKTALQGPDNIVLTRSAARKYFGRDTPVGETIVLGDNHLMKVTAVIEDLPSYRTRLKSGIFASGSARFSELPKERCGRDPNNICMNTYFRLRVGAGIDGLQSRMPAFLESVFPEKSRPFTEASLLLIRLDKVRLSPGLSPGVSSHILEMAMMGALTLFIACINFVNLSIARVTRRALEVGVRKAVGAQRGALIVQFLIESLITGFMALCVAVALVEWLLPHFNALVGSAVSFEYWHEPKFLGALLVTVSVLGILAGLYPAWVLSSFRPAAVLKGQLLHHVSSGVIKQWLVSLQFAILIAFAISTAVIYQQQTYARSEALRVDSDQILMVHSKCNTAFKNEVKVLPGVEGVACTNMFLLSINRVMPITLADGSKVLPAVVLAEAGLLELFGLKPLAGRFFSEDRTRDADASASPDAEQRVVINETAVALFGFTSPPAAVGKIISLESGREAEIIGVVPDFSLRSLDRKIDASVYLTADPDEPPLAPGLITIKLVGHDIPETLAAIDSLWLKSGEARPIARFFLNGYVQDLYQELTAQAQIFALCASIAVLLACLGLFALATHVAERKTKEIGIRKAMGAGTSEVMQMLAWQFIQPVLWANLIAWPVAGLVMNRWLQGFAYHSDLSPWLFIGATAVALAIALLTVSVHCYLVARAKPVAALRYE